MSNFEKSSCNSVIVLGPTASGKTSLGVKLALKFNGEIISADSRQVYKGLDIGSGKDLNEYTVDDVKVPYHLIDVVTLDDEYNVFTFQKDFYKVFPEVIARKKLPIVVGGTGMYLDSIIRNYNMIEVSDNEDRRSQLEKMSLDKLNEILLTLRPNLHTMEDLRHKERCIKAIEIAECMKEKDAKGIPSTVSLRPDIRPLVIGVTYPREEIRKRIEARLKERLDNGMIEEVETLHENGTSWHRLEVLGLEYKFVAFFLQGKIKTKDELYEKLNIAIRQFAKRQETWFRGMEKKMQQISLGIHWLSSSADSEKKLEEASTLLEKVFAR
ncbi:MAG: tRNA (adenosine(37)-N6)-dimethylallyltransferase MiaA [Treponema sp.]|nr:tRNA (adenosine(37)-N6)-dimethylallyltransferase MiaA [Treponema sp.]